MDDALTFPAHLVPRTQALSSSTFRLPPLDGSLHPAEFPEWLAEHSPDHPLFVYERPGGGVQTLRWADAAQAVLHAAQRMRTLLGWVPGLAHGGKVPIVGVLASLDSITYWTVANGLIRAGYVVFPMSTVNSPAALAHLVKAVGVRHLLVSADAAMQGLAAAGLSLLQEERGSKSDVPCYPIPLFEDLYWQPRLASADIPYERLSAGDTIICLHSSGSTGLPKPIPWTNRRWLQSAAYIFFGDMDLTGKVHSIHAAPIFRSLGYAITIFATGTGMTLSTFASQSPPQVWSADAHFAAAVATATDIVITAPFVFEAWAARKECVAWLATTACAVYGGGPLDEGAGRLLVSQGVNLHSSYGFTELAASAQKPFANREGIDPYDYEWQELAGNILAEFVPQGDGTFECVMLSHPLSEPAIINCEVRGLPSYATGDLVERHPVNPALWRLVGRKDDRIVHSTGDKTQPIPLETIINLNPHVRGCVVFGNGRLRAGLLIHPQAEHADLPLEALRALVWPSIEKANAVAPGHSRIAKEMVIAAAPGRPLTYTAKGTVARQVALREYEREVEQVYLQFQEPAQE